MNELVLDKNNFETEVLHSDMPVLVDFWAPWCGPCQMMGPVISKLALETGDRYKVGKVNIDENEDLASEFDVMSIPTIKLFRNGKVIMTNIGAVTKEKLENMIDESLA